MDAYRAFQAKLAATADVFVNIDDFVIDRLLAAE